MQETPESHSHRMGLWVAGLALFCLGLAIIGLSLVAPDLNPMQPGSSADGISASDQDTLLFVSSPEANLLLNREPTSPPTPSPTPPPVIIYISGAIHRPDVYELPHDARVKDAVLAAGGLTPDADRERTNLAAHIHDAEHIHIASKGKASPALTPQAVSSESSVQASGSPGSPGPPINVNTASASELQQLTGIGEVLAQRIIDYRSNHGPFGTVDELQHIQGISTNVIEDIRAYVTVGKQ